MIQTNKELYKEINNIIAVLDLIDNQNFSQQLSGALSISTVPSEMLGGSRLVLLKLRKTDLLEILGIQKDVDVASRYLNEILK